MGTILKSILQTSLLTMWIESCLHFVRFWRNFMTSTNLRVQRSV